MPDEAAAVETPAPAAESTGAGEGVSPLEKYGFSDPYKKDAPATAPAPGDNATHSESARAQKADDTAQATATTAKTESNAPAAAPADPYANSADRDAADLKRFRSLEKTIKELEEEGLNSDDAIAARRADQQKRFNAEAEEKARDARIRPIHQAIYERYQSGALTGAEANAELANETAKIDAAITEEKNRAALTTERAQVEAQRMDIELSGLYTQNPSIKASGGDAIVEALAKNKLLAPDKAVALVAHMLKEAGAREVAAYVAKQASNGNAAPLSGGQGGPDVNSTESPEAPPRTLSDFFPNVMRQYRNA